MNTMSLNAHVLASIAEHKANKRRLAFQLLDLEALELVRAALYEQERATIREMQGLRRRRALDRIRGRFWADAGVYLASQLGRRHGAILGVLDALGN